MTVKVCKQCGASIEPSGGRMVREVLVTRTETRSADPSQGRYYPDQVPVEQSTQDVLWCLNCASVVMGPAERKIRQHQLGTEIEAELTNRGIGWDEIEIPLRFFASKPFGIPSDEPRDDDQLAPKWKKRPRRLNMRALT